MAKYEINLIMFHGTTTENANSIKLNGYKELFLTNKRSKAESYGGSVLVFAKQFCFNNRIHFNRFKKQVYKTSFTSDFIDYLAKDNEVKPVVMYSILPDGGMILGTIIN